MVPCAPFLLIMVDRARGDLGYAAAFILLASAVEVKAACVEGATTRRGGNDQ